MIRDAVMADILLSPGMVFAPFRGIWYSELEGSKQRKGQGMTKIEREPTISDAAVVEGTGKTFEEWFRIIDSWGGRERTHKEIASHLRIKHSASPWWAQEITVRYEKHIKRRVTGQTSSGLFQIGVSRTLPVGHNRAWELVTGTDAARAIVGEGAGEGITESSSGVGENGIRYEVRVFKPLSHIRMRWKMEDWGEDSTLQIRVIPKSARATTVTFHHENLESSRIRDQMRARWKDVLEQLERNVKDGQG